jgi:ribose/xylose/arabinose/galactoside ABC-type transport system permease subunit
MHNGKTSLAFLARNWSLMFLLTLIVFFSIFGRNFFSFRNFNNIMIAATTTMLLATGETFVIISGGIDLSIGFVMGFVAVSSATVMQRLYARGEGYSELFCIVVGCLAGLLLGLIPGFVNGLLIAKFRVPPFIATLGMYGIANGLAWKICEGFPVTFLPPISGQIGNGFFAYFSSKAGFAFFEKPQLTERADILALIGLVPVAVFIVVVLLVIFGVMLAKTKFGQHTYAIGGNVDAAIRSGINVPWHLIKIYMLSSFLAACAAVLMVLRFTMGNHTMFSASYELFAIAAIVIGGASLSGGSGTIMGTALGVILLSVLETGFVIIGIQVFYRYIAVGCILIFAVLIDQFFPELVHQEE